MNRFEPDKRHLRCDISFYWPFRNVEQATQIRLLSGQVHPDRPGRTFLSRHKILKSQKSFNQLPVEPLMIGNHELEVEILPPEQRNRLDGINDN